MDQKHYVNRLKAHCNLIVVFVKWSLTVSHTSSGSYKQVTLLCHLCTIQWETFQARANIAIRQDTKI